MVGWCLGAAYSQDDMTEVDPSVFAGPQRPAALFEHDTHNETAGIDECGRCHHVFDDEGNLLEDASSEDMRCADCHDVEASGAVPSLLDAFHTNCKGCHLEEEKGPIMCGECHVRR